jgi:hypothetical protein
VLAAVKDKPAVGADAPSVTAAARDGEDFLQAGAKGCLSAEPKDESNGSFRNGSELTPTRN